LKLIAVGGSIRRIQNLLEPRKITKFVGSRKTLMATHLEPLQEVERLSDTVIRILGGNPGKVDSDIHDMYALEN
jgi:hypothetical protein